MRKLAFLASAVLSVAALTVGCGGGTQTTQPLAPRSVSLSIRDNPPAGVSVLSFEINVTGATLQPSDASKGAVPLVTSPIEVELYPIGDREGVTERTERSARQLQQPVPHVQDRS